MTLCNYLKEKINSNENEQVSVTNQILESLNTYPNFNSSTPWPAMNSAGQVRLTFIYLAVYLYTTLTNAKHSRVVYKD